MIRSNITCFRIAAFPCAAVSSAIFLLTMAAAPLAAQDVAETAVEPSHGEAQAHPAAVEPSAPSLAATPSRNVTPEQFKDYIGAVTTAFSMRGRATDPFGLPQEPGARSSADSALAAANTNSPRYEPVKPAPFSDIVKMITVNTVMPGERAFLIGNRRIDQGDHLPVTHRGKNIMIEVVSVNSSRITFRNLENGESASLALDLMPAGMRAGSSGITAPGFSSNKAGAPLNLDAQTNPLYPAPGP
jgi:hypothetical protein